MSNNIQRLGETILGRISKTINAAEGVYTELGTINDNMTLTPDSLNVPIPEEDYLLLEGVRVQPEDRVLICWCGNDPVVAGPATEERQALPVQVTDDGQGNVTITF